MNKEYILKHKNIPVISFQMDDETYESGMITEIHNIDHLPFGEQRRNTKESIATYLNRWINFRGIPQSREDFGDISLLNKINNGKQLSMGSYGLNLTDHYWVHKKDKNYMWENFNFFDNSYKDNFEMKSEYYNIADKVSIYNPNVSVDGTLVKCWNNENNGHQLWKKGRGLTKQEPYNEVIASKIMDLFNIDHIPYTLSKLSNGSPVSKCPCVIDKDTEYINADYILFDEKLTGGNLYISYVNNCKNKGIKNAKERIDEMAAIDFLIGNTDRHYGNFGIIRDVNNLNWIKIFPIFDNGNSLFYNIELLDDIIEKIDSNCIWFPGSNLECLKMINFPEWYDTKKGKDIPSIVYNGLHENERLSNVRIDQIVKIIEERIKIFENIISNK